MDGIAGSYCVKDGTSITDSSVLPEASCDAATHNCGFSHPTLPVPEHPPQIDLATTTLFDSVSVAPGRCLPLHLPLDAANRAECTVLEVTSNPAEADCGTRPGRKVAADLFVTAARSLLGRHGLFDASAPSTPACASLAICEIQQTDESCRTLTPGASTVGWCYVAPQMGLGAPALVENCPPGYPQIIRFVDPERATPALDATTLIACHGVEK